MTNSSSPNKFNCLNTAAEVVTVALFLVCRFLLVLPASVLALYLGLQRWRRRCSHSDIFTYNSAALELIYALGALFNICGRYGGVFQVMVTGYYLCCIALPGQTSLHILTCVDRYLAVVHPVTYLGLKQRGGVRIRGLSLGCVWLLCVVWIGLTALYSPRFPYAPFFCILLLFLVVTSFCSISVLRSLIGTGPGERGVNGERVDPSKQRAFSTITAIAAVLWIYFLGILVCVTLDNSLVLTDQANMSCLLLVSGQWFSLPCSLVLPLLFLHSRAKLLCCKT